MKRLLPLAALLTFAAVGPAQAQLFGGDTEARNQIHRLRQDVQGQLETTGRGQLELAMQNEQLRAEVARLRGQIELLTNEVETLKQRQKDFYVDLDARLRQIETGAPRAGAGGDPAAESADYEAALNLLKEGKHQDALTAFDTFLTRYPNGSFSAGAHFWAGNAALQGRDTASANKHFNAVLQNWPQDNVAPDAMLGLANSQQAMGDAAAARRTLQGLVERYPQSNAAQVARQRLSAR